MKEDEASALLEMGISLARWLWGKRAEISKALYEAGPVRESVGCGRCGKVLRVSKIEKDSAGNLLIPFHDCKP